MKVTVSALLATISALAFLLFYDALVSLAVQAHIAGSVAWAYPLVVDGSGLLCALSLAYLSTSRNARGLRVAAAMSAFYGATSMMANALHGAGVHLPTWGAALLASLPPAAMLGGLHQLLNLWTVPARPKPAKRATAAVVPVEPVTDARRAVDRDKVRAWIAAELAAGRVPTGSQLAERAAGSISRRTGLRWVQAEQAAA